MEKDTKTSCLGMELFTYISSFTENNPHNILIVEAQSKLLAFLCLIHVKMSFWMNTFDK